MLKEMEWKNTDVAINDIRVLFVRYQNIFLINEVRKEDNMSRRFNPISPGLKIGYKSRAEANLPLQ